MVSKHLQHKFFSTLDRMKDGSNDALVESLKEGALAIFESGVITENEYVKEGERPIPSSMGRVRKMPRISDKGLSKITGTPMHKDEFTSDELAFGRPVEAFPEDGNDDFTETELDEIFERNNDIAHAYDDLDYSAVAESVKQEKFKAFLESICAAYNCPEMCKTLKEGFKYCFEAVAGQPMTMRVEHTVDDSLPDKSGEFKEQEVVYVQVNDHITVRITHDYCEYLVDNLIEETMGFPDVEFHPSGMRVEHTVDDSLPDKNGDFKEQEVVYVQVNDHITVRITHDYCEYLEDGHIEHTMGFPDDETHQTPEQAV